MEVFQAMKSAFVYFKVEVLAPQTYLSWCKHYALMIHVDKCQLTKCGTTVLQLCKGRQMFLYIYHLITNLLFGICVEDLAQNNKPLW